MIKTYLTLRVIVRGLKGLFAYVHDIMFEWHSFMPALYEIQLVSIYVYFSAVSHV